MFSATDDPAGAAAEAADYFGDFKEFKSHGRRVSRDDARAVKLNVTDLEADQTLQDLALSVHHAARLTFSTGAVKLVENHHGRAYIETTQQIFVQGSLTGPAAYPIRPAESPVLPSGAPPVAPAAPQLPRAQRRANRGRKK